MNEQVKNLPIVTIAIVVINTLVWIVLEAIGSTYDPYFMLEHGACYAPYLLERGEWWRLFTCTFLHFGSAHLVNNMFILILTGMRLEKVLGRLYYAVVYLLSGISGSVLSFCMEVKSQEPSISAGASGAIFGVLGGLIAVAVFNHGKVEEFTIRGLLVLLALNLYNGFVSVSVDNWGHIGGFLGGFVISFIFCFWGKYRKY